jgi:hypothetical protein
MPVMLDTVEIFFSFQVVQLEGSGGLRGEAWTLDSWRPQETSGDRGLTTISEGLGGVLTNNAGWPLFDGKYVVAYS